MKLMAEGGAEIRFWAACLLPGLAFATAATDESAAAIGPLVLLLVAVLMLALAQTSGSGAAWVTVDSQSLVAHFTFRSSESIPLGRIAAVEVRRRTMWTRRSLFPESLAFISVFRKVEPSVIEIRTRSWAAAPLQLALARNAKRLGLAQVTPFSIPGRHYVHDLLPLLPALVIVFVLPFRVSWSSLALALGAFLLYSVLAWRRFAKLAQGIASGRVPSGILVWAELLRTA